MTEPTQIQILEQALEAKLQALELDGSSVVIARLVRDPEASPEHYGERAAGVMRALAHAIRETGSDVPPILVTDQTIAIQLEPNHHLLLRDLHAHLERHRVKDDPDALVLWSRELSDRLLQAFAPQTEAAPDPQVAERDAEELGKGSDPKLPTDDPEPRGGSRADGPLLR